MALNKVKLAIICLGLGSQTFAFCHPGLAELMNRADIRTRLRAHLEHLSVKLGERSVSRPHTLKAAEEYVFETFQRLGYAPQRQGFDFHGLDVGNILSGPAPDAGYYILGAHYDTVAGTPGADDNASGMAVLLEVARLAQGVSLPRPWVFIGFTTEEPPAFATPLMGSQVYAQKARARQDQILGMLCLEMVGYYSREPGSQSLPLALRLSGYPTTGDFIGLVGDSRSKPLLRGLEAALKLGGRLPTVALTAPLEGYLLPEVRLSDHANFWDAGYPAVMLTDTAFLRHPHYPGAGDVMGLLDLEAMTELVLDLGHFLQEAGR